VTSGIFHSIPVNDITIPPNRQRKVRASAHIPNLAKSIREHGLIHPIVITRDLILVAGECRLTAVRDHLSWTNIPSQYQDELEEWVLWGIELEENISRSDLDWRDKTTAIARYHELRKAADPSWSQAKTAEAISVTQQTVQGHLKVASNLNDPVVAGASTFETALNTARRKEERALSDQLNAHNAIVNTPQSPILTADFHL